MRGRWLRWGRSMLTSSIRRDDGIRDLCEVRVVCLVGDSLRRLGRRFLGGGLRFVALVVFELLHNVLRK